jgi:hypothetical protein
LAHGSTCFLYFSLLGENVMLKRKPLLWPWMVIFIQQKCLSWTHARYIFFKIVLVVNNKLLSCVYICTSIEVVTWALCNNRVHWPYWEWLASWKRINGSGHIVISKTCFPSVPSSQLLHTKVLNQANNMNTYSIDLFYFILNQGKETFSFIKKKFYKAGEDR